MLHLRRLSRRKNGYGYPMDTPMVRSLDSLEFTQPVTFLTGENGSGKTTLIELLADMTHAVRIDGNAAPGEKHRMIQAAAPNFRIELAHRPAHCFYFHAEGFIRYMYEHNITARSHGESFLDFFGGRIHPNGLYLLDEPEAALSFFNQYVLLNMIRDAVKQRCQFIISTHSPVLTALPGADVLYIEDGIISPISYDALPGVAFLRDFLAAPQHYLRDD